MMRFWYLPLLFCALSTTCSGQTFQYSRGWTNGKRGSVGVGYNDEVTSNYDQISKVPITVGMSEEEFMDKCPPKILKCLLRMQHNPLLLRAMFFATQDHSTARSSPWNQVHDVDLSDYDQDNQNYKKMSLKKPHQSTNSFYENSKLVKGATEDEVASVNDYGHH